jgi:hypothetical protein
MAAPARIHFEVALPKNGFFSLIVISCRRQPSGRRRHNEVEFNLKLGNVPVMRAQSLLKNVRNGYADTIS